MLPLLTLAFLLALPSGKSDHRDRTVHAQQLLRATLAARDSLPLEDYVKQLEQVTRLDKRNAEAFLELGRAYTRLETVWGRERALLAIERAIQLQPRNTDFHYALAELHLKRTFDGAAKDEFKRMIQLDPSDARPYYHLALFEEEDMLHYREMVSLHENATIFFSDFAEEDYREAEKLYRTAIAFDPHLLAASYRLAGLYFEARRFEEMAEVLQAALLQRMPAANHGAAASLLRQPTYFDLNLLLGLALTRLHQTEEAQRAFEAAFAEMSNEDRQLFFSLATVLSPKELKAYLAAADTSRRLEEQNFWNARDPLFMTSANERTLEHFSRMAYANLRFSFPERKVAGWKTDRGQALIRFGFPKGRVRTRADLGTTPTGHVTLNSSREVWDYGDFHMLYEDRFLNRNYSFAWSMAPEGDGKNLFDRQIRITPERFEFEHGGKRLQLPHVIAQFRSPQRDGTLLEVYYGLAASDLEPSRKTSEQRQYQLERGFFLCDQNWQPVFSHHEPRRLNFSHAANGGAALLIDRWSLPAPAGRFNFSLEARDRVTNHSGAERDTLTIADFSTDSLRLSSVVLASRVAEAGADLALYRKGEFALIPNLRRQFEADSTLYLYYEIYNLAFNPSGQTSFRLEHTIVPAPPQPTPLANAFKTLGRWLGMNERPVAITSSFQASGTTAEEKLHHALALPGAKPGAYRLAIAVLDLNSQQRFSRAVDFEIR
jgi:GWxTD domain-containing protein